MAYQFNKGIALDGMKGQAPYGKLRYAYPHERNIL